MTNCPVTKKKQPKSRLHSREINRFNQYVKTETTSWHKQINPNEPLKLKVIWDCFLRPTQTLARSSRSGVSFAANPPWIRKIARISSREGHSPKAQCRYFLSKIEKSTAVVHFFDRTILFLFICLCHSIFILAILF